MMDAAEQSRRDSERLTRYSLHISKMKRRIVVTSNSAACLISVQERVGRDWKSIRTVNGPNATAAINELIGKARYDEKTKSYL